jgi:ubiquinone/menaquinone biosynthesis C-methylase UbiE/uncharacterized protein YbaR (Trm112 family)
MNEWLIEHLVCPRDKQNLRYENNELVCDQGHIYPIVEDIPIMLVEEEERIHGYITETLENVGKLKSDNEKEPEIFENKAGVDSFVQAEILYTSGNLYRAAQNNLTRYPIPEIRLPQGNGERLLDVGCNWGRWSIAAAQKGYKPVGLDPSLKAVQAAKRVSKQLGLETQFVVGDARLLPFAENSFDIGFSYGVLQHFSKDNAKISMNQIAHATKNEGKILIQMPAKYGIRSVQQQIRRGFSEGEDFDIRYWSPAELVETFEQIFGQTKLFTDCYFGLGVQKTDIDLMPPLYKLIVRSSEVLRKMSNNIPLMTKVADSIWAESVNQK